MRVIITLLAASILTFGASVRGVRGQIPDPAINTPDGAGRWDAAKLAVFDDWMSDGFLA